MDADTQEDADESARGEEGAEEMAGFRERLEPEPVRSGRQAR